MSVQNVLKFTSLLIETGKQVVDMKDIQGIMKQHNMKEPQWLTKDKCARAGRGLFHVPFAKSVDEKALDK